MSNRQTATARDQLAAMAVRAKVKLREARILDTNVDGHYLSVKCSFKHLGHRLECCASSDLLRLRLRGLPSLLALSVGQTDMALTAERLRMTIGRSRLPVYGYGIHVWPAASATRWLRVKSNRAAVEVLDLRDGESLRLWLGDLCLYVRPRESEENWQLLDRLCELADLLPPQEASRAREEMAAMAAQATAKPQRVALFDRNAAWPFDTECLLKSAGQRVGMQTNGDVLRLEVRDVATRIQFSVGKPDAICLFDERLPLTVGRSRLPVFRALDLPDTSPLQWLGTQTNLAVISGLDLHRGESLHVYGNGLVAYFKPRGVEANFELLDGLCKLADLLPPEEIELAEGEELVDGLAFDPSRLPTGLQHLAPLIRKWAIGDDVKRSEAQQAASAAQLRRLVSQVAPHFEAIDAYLRSVEGDAPYPNEAILIGWLAECAAEARLQLGEA